MKKILFISALLLSGCTTVVPVKNDMPAIPTTFPDQCESLKKVEGETATFEQFLKTVAGNYTLYHECALNYKSLIEWYKEQQKIFNNVE
jgi:hypothetical protein